MARWTRRSKLITLVVGLILGGTVTWVLAQGTGFIPNHIAPTVSNAYDVGNTTYLWRSGYFGTSLTVGTSGTAITQTRVYSQVLSPTLMAAVTPTGALGGAIEQAFTVTGLSTSDLVFINGPAPTALCPWVKGRVSATNTLSVMFAQLTSAACQPATGTVGIVAIRS
jgi:hypothetical protein